MISKTRKKTKTKNRKLVQRSAKSVLAGVINQEEGKQDVADVEVAERQLIPEVG